MLIMLFCSFDPPLVPLHQAFLALTYYAECRKSSIGTTEVPCTKTLTYLIYCHTVYLSLILAEGRSFPLIFFFV
jgi:hypothetical protein